MNLAAQLCEAQGIKSKQEALILRSIWRDIYKRRRCRNPNELMSLLLFVSFTSTDCWAWCGHLNMDGYAVSGMATVHRKMWRIFYGEIPKNLCVLHKCDIRNCINPEHLFLGTQQDNIKDMNDKRRNRPCRGDVNGRAILTIDQVNQIRQSKEIRSSLARIYNVSWSTINRIKKGETWNENIRTN